VDELLWKLGFTQIAAGKDRRFFDLLPATAVLQRTLRLMGKNILYQLGVFGAKFCGRGDPGNIIKKIPSRFPGSAHKRFIYEVSSGQDPGWT
jgi:hypothetical protein